jgi:hypothetical protein
MYLTDLRGMVAQFGGLPMPDVERRFGEVVIDGVATARVVRMIQRGGEESSAEEGLEDEGTEEEISEDEVSDDEEN